MFLLPKVVKIASLCLLAVSVIVAPAYSQKKKRVKEESAEETAPQNPVYQNMVLDANIKTVQLFRADNELSYPILSLNDGQLLTLKFDWLGTKVQNFRVTFFHCDENWEQSMLLPIQFFDGIADDRINEFRASQNTLVNYIHYSYQFPREGQTFKHSGNYILKVYREGNPDDVVLTRRFLIADNVARIAPQAGITTNTRERYRMQSVSFSIYPNGLLMNDPFNDLKIRVMQNFRWDNSKSGFRPTYMFPDHYDYRFDANNDFAGGNEYRMFDTRNIQQSYGRIQQMNRMDSVTSVQIMPDYPRPTNAYNSDPDLNGFFYIDIRQARSYREVEADYVDVQLFLKKKEPILEGEVYVFGQLTDWNVQERFRMVFDQNGYHGRFRLKQGLYNYHYVVQDRATGTIDETQIEGSHFETENHYTILVYYRGMTDRADRLVGFKHLNYYE